MYIPQTDFIDHCMLLMDLLRLRMSVNHQVRTEKIFTSVSY